MPVPLSQDLRKRIVAAVRRGSSARAAARHYDVSASAAINLVNRERTTGSIAPAKIGGHRTRILAQHERFLRDQVERKPGITLAELRTCLAERGVAVKSLETVRRMLRHLGLRHKKRA